MRCLFTSYRMLIPLGAAAVLGLSPLSLATVVTNPTLQQGSSAIDPVSTNDEEIDTRPGTVSESDLEANPDFYVAQDFPGFEGVHGDGSGVNYFNFTGVNEDKFYDMRFKITDAQENYNTVSGAERSGGGNASSADSYLFLDANDNYTVSQTLHIDFGDYDDASGTFTPLDAWGLSSASVVSPNITARTKMRASFRDAQGKILSQQVVGHQRNSFDTTDSNPGDHNGLDSLFSYENTGKGAVASIDLRRVSRTNGSNGVDDVGFTVQTPAPSTMREGFGREWVRSHPLTIMGVNRGGSFLGADTSQYTDAGMNNLIITGGDGATSDAIDKAEADGLPFMVINHLDPSDRRLGFLNSDQAAGYVQTDEPNYQEMEETGRMIDQLQNHHPDQLGYSNAYPNYATPGQLYGGTPPAGYDYQQYLDDFVDIIEPDVLMYDYYPFLQNQRLRSGYFTNLRDVRNKALEADIPYWSYVQSWDRNAYREPSESDMRMQVFSLLAAGYKGISYWTYGYYRDATHGMVNDEFSEGGPKPTPLYHHAADLNPEAENLGRSLRYLKSTAIRFVPGKSISGGVHGTPRGLTNFSPGDGGDPHIQAVEVTESGDAKDGFIGFFTDDRDQHYFMLTNLYHGANLTPEEAAVDFEIVFDSEVDKILRLNRETGEQEVIDLTAHTLNLTLPGGTGDLFKYDTGDFVIPEPASLALLGLGGLVLMGRRRRRTG